MKILITGVNGLLGLDLAKLLCKNKNYEIFGVARSNSEINEKNYTHIQLDLNTPDFINKLPHKLDAIIHLAQSEKFRDFPNSAIEVFNVNTLSTLHLLNYAKEEGVKQFIYASSGGVYGNKDDGFTEESPLIGNGDLGFYLSTKLCSEILADNYSNFFNVIQLRFFFMYGERQNKTMLIPRLINSVQMGLPITLQGTEGIKINPIYVKDAALAVEKALYIGHSDKINVAGPNILSIKNIVEIISEKTGKKPIFKSISGEPSNLIGDTKKMKQLLHSTPITFENGIELLTNNVR